jgi:hypothetical protein
MPLVPSPALSSRDPGGEPRTTGDVVYLALWATPCFYRPLRAAADKLPGPGVVVKRVSTPLCWTFPRFPWSATYKTFLDP